MGTVMHVSYKKSDWIVKEWCKKEIVHGSYAEKDTAMYYGKQPIAS